MSELSSVKDIDCYGERRIDKVFVEQWYDENDQVEYAHLRIIAKTGEHFLVAFLRKEDADKLCAAYEKQGWTDKRCLPQENVFKLLGEINVDCFGC
jgi:hypothetical protein